MRCAAIFLTLIALFATTILADVPPDPGYERQSANLVLEPATDLSGFLFFLDSPSEIEEIRIAAGGPTVVNASGRAGASRFGRLIAIPAREYEQFGSRLTEEEFRQALSEKKLFTSTELLSHNFQTTIPEGSTFQDPVYRIEKDGETGLKAIQVSGGVSTGGIIQSSGRQFWGSAAAAVIAGIFLIFGVALLGIWYLRKSSKHP